MFKDGLRMVDIYTDGACSGNPGPGGWGVVLVCDGKWKTMCGSDKQTTNNKMELMAVVQGLKALKEECNVTVYSDSAYIVNSVNLGWLDNWFKAGWKLASGEPVANVDLWEEILGQFRQHHIEFRKVKGHSGNQFNEIADKLAVQAKMKGV